MDRSERGQRTAALAHISPTTAVALAAEQGNDAIGLTLAAIASTDPSPARDRAATEPLSSYDRPAALVWIATIEDESIRHNAASAAAPYLSLPGLETLHSGNLISDSTYQRHTGPLTSESALIEFLRATTP